MWTKLRLNSDFLSHNKAALLQSALLEKNHPVFFLQDLSSRKSFCFSLAHSRKSQHFRYTAVHTKQKFSSLGKYSANFKYEY